VADVIEQQQEPIPAPTVVVKKSRAGLLIGIIAIVLTIALGAAGFYFFQQLRSSQDSENNQDNLKLIEVDKEMRK